jgi:hypothetical protein
VRAASVSTRRETNKIRRGDRPGEDLALTGLLAFGSISQVSLYVYLSRTFNFLKSGVVPTGL